MIVDIDSGILKIPQDIEMEIPPLPTAFRHYLTHCLKVLAGLKVEKSLITICVKN